MSRYTDAEWLIRQIESPYTEYTVMIQIRRALKEFINSAPSIDIVKCVECKYRGTWKCMIRDMYVPREPKLDDFCSYGEREDE